MANEALYVLATGLVKISILCFYRRITKNSISKGFIRANRVCIGVVVCYMVVFEVTLFVGCSPFDAFWNQVDPSWLLVNEGRWHCIDEAGNLIAATVVSIVTDFVTFLMPCTLFWKLQLPRRQKVGLGAIFGVGFL